MSGDLPYLKVMWKRDHEITASVVSVDVEDHDRLVDKATIVLRDPHVSAPNIDRNDELEVTLGWQGEHAVLFSGRVVDTPGSAPATGTPTVTLVAYDRSYAMHVQHTDAHHEGRLSTIVQTVASRYGADVVVAPATIVCDPDPQFTGDPQLRQLNLTDLQFLQWLAWRYGHRAFVEYNEGANRFYFVSNHRLLQGDPMGVLQWCHGMRQLKEFSYGRVASRAVRQRVAAVPDPSTGDAPPTTGQTPPPVDPAPPNPTHAATLGRSRPRRAGPIRVGCRRRPAHAPDGAGARARAPVRPAPRGRRHRLGPHAGAGPAGHRDSGGHGAPARQGEGDDRGARPVGRGRLVREHGGALLARHHGRRARAQRHVRDEVHGDQMTIYTPAGATDLDRHRGRWYGKYSGVVVDDDDPQMLGRLKVNVPSVWRGDDAMWARPCFPAGHFFTPPVGAHVWVEFEAGDPGYPLWVGVWFADGEVPDEAALEPPTSRVIRTPSGHTMEFADEDGAEKITLRHKADAFVSIDENGSVVVGNATGSLVFLNAHDAEVAVVSEQGHRVTMSGDGLTLTHNDGSFVDVRSDSVTVNASAKVQVMGREVAVTGGAVSLGAGPLQFGVVLDSPAFELFLNHTHPSAMGPTGPPLPPAIATTMVSTSVKAST